jgi:hypothetical protein
MSDALLVAQDIGAIPYKAREADVLTDRQGFAPGWVTVWHDNHRRALTRRLADEPGTGIFDGTTRFPVCHPWLPRLLIGHQHRNRCPAGRGAGKNPVRPVGGSLVAARTGAAGPTALSRAPGTDDPSDGGSHP